tara:strand:+ start:1291 stop:1596 length:306 start_codon:yes stop_codon:yes gene_type:complete
MSAYNNGHWHPWTGGGLPVHPESTVDVMFNDGQTTTNTHADEWDWSLDTCTTIVAFKVTKEFKAEPREFWIANMGRVQHQCHIQYQEPDDLYGYIHVREVL